MKCFKCGKNEAVQDGLCRECYLATHDLVKVPDYIDLYVCSHCGAISSDGKRWTDYEDFNEGLEESAASRISVSRGTVITEEESSVIEKDPHTYVLKGHLSLKTGPIFSEKDFQSTIRIKTSTCPRCTRLHGGYYEAIIQIRASDRAMSEEEKTEYEDIVSSRIEEMKNISRDIFITQEEEVHGGIDIYVSKSRAAKSTARYLAEEVAGRLTESKKLAGRKEGEDFYRFTYLVRLPEYRKGDFVEYLGKYYRVLGVTGSTWKLLSMEKGNEIKVRGRDAEKFKLSAKKEDSEEWIVVSAGNGEIQALDPNNYRTITLRCADKPGEKVKVIRLGDELYALPDD